MVKPITYYCDALTSEQAAAIEALGTAELILTLGDVGNYLYEHHHERANPYLVLSFPYLNARDKVKLIRGLCDRIEDKLQEAKSL